MKKINVEKVSQSVDIVSGLVVGYTVDKAISKFTDRSQRGFFSRVAISLGSMVIGSYISDKVSKHFTNVYAKSFVNSYNDSLDYANEKIAEEKAEVQVKETPKEVKMAKDDIDKAYSKDISSQSVKKED